MASDPAIIATLYADEHQPLHRRFLRHGRSAASAADLVQETFIRLLRSQTAEINDLRAYLYRVADSAESDLRRVELRARRVIEPDAAPDETIADPCPQVETTLISREENAAISRAIMDLPPRAREVLLLHKYENLSYAEIAERLGIARNTVMVHMVRALSALRQRLTDPQQPDPSGDDG